MILDTGGPDRTAFDRPFDACIVGAGPAGITLARRLAAAGMEVALLEGGDLDFTTASQRLYAGETAGMEYFALDVARLRYFGGTSNHWGGACRPLDAQDFVPRPYQPFSGWPIEKRDLDPYQAETDAILDLPGPAGFPDPAPPRPEADLHAIRYRHSPPTRFGTKYRAEIAASERIHLGLNANLVDLRLDPALGTLAEARFRSLAPGDPDFTLRAERYVLCAGGIENPRILLNARGQLPAGIGNGTGLVGRFFAEHPYVKLGEILFRDPFYGREHYAPSAEFQAARQLVNFNVNLRKAREVERPLSLPKEIVRDLACRSPFTERLAARLAGNTLRCEEDLGVAEYFARRNPPEARFGSAELQMEQVLDPENRVRLGAQTDALGLNRIALTWRLQDIDRRTVRAAMLSFGTMLAAQDRGRMRVSDWLLDEDWRAGVEAGDIRGSFHHMCTTRMSDDPRQGVVDRDCRVHGVSNLYIGGSSVFATAGHATPTYTIVQLALRLGDHLAATADSSLEIARQAPPDGAASLGEHPAVEQLQPAPKAQSSQAIPAASEA